MTKKKETEVAVIDLDLIDVNKLPELANFKERGLKLVKECKFVEIKDNSTYESAKKNRTALRTFRTDVEKSDKAIKSKLNNFKNRVGEVSASLIAITEPAEKTQQEEVERYEQIKENERLEKLRLEQERVDNIKKSISDFANHWNSRISLLEFSEIEEFEAQLKEAFVNFDKSSLAEFEVLYDDSVNLVNSTLSAKIKTLTEQEEIRIAQIELAKEKERQRIENERIAEEQRKEREKLEAEQKAEAEKIRLAKEAFEKEKWEFENRLREVKFQSRCKQLTEIGFVFSERTQSYQKGLTYLNADDIRNASDELWICELADAKNVKDFSEMETQEVEFEEVKPEQSANERVFESIPLTSTSEVFIGNPIQADYHEADVDPKGLSTRLKANTPANEKEVIDKFYYIGTLKNVTDSTFSFELVFDSEDLVKFENMTIREILSPYFEQRANS